MILEICEKLYHSATRLHYKLDSQWNWYIPKFAERQIEHEVMSKYMYPGNPIFSLAERYPRLYGIDIIPGYEMAIILVYDEYIMLTEERSKHFIFRVDLALNLTDKNTYELMLKC